MLQQTDVIFKVGQSSVLPEALFHGQLCSSYAVTPLSLDDVSEQSQIRPWDRKPIKLPFLNFYQCRSEDHNLTISYIETRKKYKM